MSEKGEFQERHRRLHYVLEEHPHLSGLMTNEFQGYLSDMAHEIGSHYMSGSSWEPRCLVPDFDLELGFDDFPAEDEDGWTNRVETTT